MHYDVEADWHLLNTCNFRCKYCFFGPDTLGQKLSSFASPVEWRDAFDHTGLTWLLHLTGGEPTLYPGFADLCDRLTRDHFISVNSNLTNASIVEVSLKVSPSRVSFINAALHPIERERRGGLAKFMRHADLLNSRGFPVFVSIVATPRILAIADTIIQQLRPIGLFPAPKLFRGSYAGRIYPRDYTEAERDQFRALNAAARAAYGASFGLGGERPTIDILSDDSALEDIPQYRGRMCHAGQSFVRIEPDGGVFRCSPKTSLGNLLRGDLRLRTGPTTCDTEYCFYFCNKYSIRPAADQPKQPASVLSTTPHIGAW